MVYSTGWSIDQIQSLGMMRSLPLATAPASPPLAPTLAATLAPPASTLVQPFHHQLRGTWHVWGVSSEDWGSSSLYFGASTTLRPSIHSVAYFTVSISSSGTRVSSVFTNTISFLLLRQPRATIIFLFSVYTFYFIFNKGRLPWCFCTHAFFSGFLFLYSLFYFVFLVLF